VGIRMDLYYLFCGIIEKILKIGVDKDDT